jgi:hypothetical protein
MNRTGKRPLPTGNMSVNEGIIVVVLCLLPGLWMLYQLNLASMVLGLFAFISYVFIYTPMKRISTWAVFVGAFPGAIPPMLGAVAGSDSFGYSRSFVPGAVRMAILAFLGHCLGTLRGLFAGRIFTSSVKRRPEQNLCIPDRRIFFCINPVLAAAVAAGLDGYYNGSCGRGFNNIVLFIVASFIEEPGEERCETFDVRFVHYPSYPSIPLCSRQESGDN